MKNLLVVVISLLVLVACSKKEETEDTRAFRMGFTTWTYDFSLAAVEDTYNFVQNNGDIYAEHIDNVIPWQALIQNQVLPLSVTQEIRGRASRKKATQNLLLSVSLFDAFRNDIQTDIDGSVPAYTSLADAHIENAYFNYLVYLIDSFEPNYLVMAMEVNELAAKDPQKWQQYKQLAAKLRPRIKAKYPSLQLSESLTLHNWYQPNVANQADFIQEITAYSQNMDFVAVSFYPFMKFLNTKEEFQAAFDFLHAQTTKKIAFVETGYIAENLTLPSFNFSVLANPNEQQVYMQTLFENAQNKDYEFVIWWCHRDYDKLLPFFPEELREIGSIWRTSGILDKDGLQRLAYDTWLKWYAKSVE